MHEESVDHILLHCDKTRTLWEMFFTLFGVQWVLPSSVRATHLGWHGSFVRKKRMEVWRVSPLCIFFGCFGKTRNKIVIEDDVLAIQKLKSFFVCFLWFETKLFIKDGPSTLVGFIDWLSSYWRWGLLCTSLLTAVFVSAGWGLVYLFCFLWVTVLVSLYNILLPLFTHSKKKKKKKSRSKLGDQSPSINTKSGYS